jgi:CheY-like chemotaxis protein
MPTKYKALVIDDDKLNLEILRKSLDENGYEVTEALSAIKALDILKKDRNFHIILLDRMMPEMDGLDLLKILKDDEKLGDIPVIIQSAANKIPQIAEGYEEECYFYLTKPFKSKMMLDMVKRAIDKSYNSKVMDFKIH